MAPDRKLVFYGLSTCPYCRRAKEYLDENSIQYLLTYIDKLEGDERKEVVTKLREYNPALSFPTLVIFDSMGNHKVYIGFTEQAREAVDTLR